MVCPRCREHGFVYGPLWRHALWRWSQAWTPTLSNPPSLQLFQHHLLFFFLLSSKMSKISSSLLLTQFNTSETETFILAKNPKQIKPDLSLGTSNDFVDYWFFSYFSWAHHYESIWSLSVAGGQHFHVMLLPPRKTLTVRSVCARPL